MHKFFHKYALLISILLFVLSVTIAGKVFAIGRPDTTTGGNPGYNATSNPGSGYAPQQDNQQPTQGQQTNYQQAIPPQANTQGSGQTGSGATPSTEPTCTPRPACLDSVPRCELAEPRGGFCPPTVSPVPSGMQQQGQSHMPAFAQVHLQDAKLRACQAIASSLTTRSNHLIDLVNQQIKTFTSIALGVEQYYLTKVVPSGSTLANYDSLVADITTKQTAVSSPLQAAQNDITTFSCTGNNPAAQLTQFRTDMQAVLTALQTYRTSIKNLIVAIVSLPSTTKPSTSPSASPITTGQPSVTQ